MEKIHPEGIFAAEIDGRKRRYRLRIESGGRYRDVEDPYRFPSPLGELDLHLIAEGSHRRLYDKIGAHPVRLGGVDGVHFAVWAPNASRVSVIGDFNGWDGRRNVMRFHPSVGVWDLFMPGIGAGTLYKFELLDAAALAHHRVHQEREAYFFQVLGQDMIPEIAREGHQVIVCDGAADQDIHGL